MIEVGRTGPAQTGRFELCCYLPSSADVVQWIMHVARRGVSSGSMMCMQLSVLYSVWPAKPCRLVACRFTYPFEAKPSSDKGMHVKGKCAVSISYPEVFFCFFLIYTEQYST